jgi:hypothetical protein
MSGQIYECVLCNRRLVPGETGPMSPDDAHQVVEDIRRFVSDITIGIDPSTPPKHSLETMVEACQVLRQHSLLATLPTMELVASVYLAGGAKA